MNDPAPAKAKAKSTSSWSWGLDLLGKAGLITSSLVVLIVLIYHRSLNPWLPVWVLIAFTVSILFILIAAHRDDGHGHYHKTFSQIAFVVAAFSSLGLLKYLSVAYRHRPLSQSEWLMGAVACGVAIICTWQMTSSQRKEYKKQLNEADVFVPSNTETSARRVLKASRRLFFTLGLAFGFVELLLVIAISMTGNLYAVLIGGAPIPIIYAAICLFITNQKIIVGPDYLAYRAPGGRVKAVNFKDVTKSRAHFLVTGTGRYAGAGGPVLDVYTSDAKRPALRIATGGFNQADIQWLTSLPEMKFH